MIPLRHVFFHLFYLTLTRMFVIYGLLQAQPTKLIFALTAVNIHASSIFLNDCLAGGTGLCIQFYPKSSAFVFVAGAEAGVPNFHSFARNRLVPLLITCETSALITFRTSHIKGFEVAVFHLHHHFTVFTRTPISLIGHIHV